MPARRGSEYIKGLQEQSRHVWIGGERVEDVTTHPAFRGGMHSIAALYDMQYDPEIGDEMTYTSPTTGDRVGLSFIVPRTQDELERRRRIEVDRLCEVDDDARVFFEPEGRERAQRGL